MRFEKDFEEFLRSFNAHKVRYCIVGAFAVGFHGYPRYTKDLDVLVDPVPENARYILAALKTFGFTSRDLAESDFCSPEQVIQLGFEPIRIDILTSLKGIAFGKVWKNRVEGTYGGERVYFISLPDLIRSKRNTGRDQDIADVNKLTARNGETGKSGSS